MTRRIVFSVLTLGFLAAPLFAQDGGQPPPPQVVAHRCIERMNRLTHETIRAIRERTHHTVQRINHLQAQGQAEQAATLAGQVSTALNNLANHRIAALGQMAEHCVARLTELEAPAELIQMVQNVATERAAMIDSQRTAALQRIQEALAD